MNQEPNNNIENTQTNLENTQPVPETTQTQPVIENAESQPVVESTQTIQMTPVSDVTEELDLPETPSENTETLQPAIEPTVTVSAPVEENKIEVDTKPHDVPIPDESSKKDFIIKSKKETVAEETRLREAKIAEHVKKANENYKPNSKVKNVFLVLFFIFIIAFTIFLPEVHNFIAKWRAGELEPEKEVKITTGVLSCSLEKSSDNLDYTYIVDFRFKDSLLESYNVSTTTKGDVSLDKDKLDTLKENCQIMSKESDSIEGITVSCVNESNSVKVVEAIELKNYKEDSITSAYTEAGGSYPKFSYHQKIDTLEKNMRADRYSCDRIAS